MSNSASTRVDWANIASWQRLIASLVATDVKLDYKEIAKFFDCTMDTMQNRFRTIRAEAATLKQQQREDGEGDCSDSQAAPASSQGSTKPYKLKQAKERGLKYVKEGRVTKKRPATKTERFVKADPDEML